MHLKYLVAALCFVLFYGCTSVVKVDDKKQAVVVKQIILPKADVRTLKDQYRYFIRRENSLLLDNLAASAERIHMRYWNDRGQAVDVTSKDNKTFYGTITTYADTVDEDYFYVKPFRTFYMKTAIDTASARVVYNAMESIGTIPTDDAINKWAYGNDGISFCFEASTPLRYTMKSYWCPATQNTDVPEAKRILIAVNAIDSALHLSTNFGAFYDAMQPGEYSLSRGYLGAFHKSAPAQLLELHLDSNEERAIATSKQHNPTDYK